jgi:pimeloyl-ACP methyl ester carboxylesterase
MSADLIATKLERLLVPIEGGRMNLLRFGQSGAPPLLFAHANGFCASAYRQMLEALGDRFDAYAVDLRGHGRTDLSVNTGRHRSMDIFARDLRALLDQLNAQLMKASPPPRWTLAGHSLGAASVTLAAVGRRDIAALRLIEPVAMPFPWPLLARTPLWKPVSSRMALVRGARRRRGVWPDRDSVRASYAKKKLFSTWADGVLGDYLEDGLCEKAGGVALSCAPQWEAASFAAQAHDFWGALAAAPAPVYVLAARHPSTTVSERSIRRLERMGVSIVRVEGRTHLFPFEDPFAAANFIGGG